MEQNAKIKLVITLAVVGVIFFLAFKFIPVKVQHSSLVDHMREEMKFAGSNPRLKGPDIRDIIWGHIIDLQMEEFILKQDNEVNKRSSRVKVKLEYSRDIEIPGYGTYTWNFVFDETREIF